VRGAEEQSFAPTRRGKRRLGGKPCQGRQPLKAGAEGPPLQGWPSSQTRQPRSTAGSCETASPPFSAGLPRR